MKNARQLAYDALAAVGKKGAYSNLALTQVLADPGIPGKEAAFASALFYGTLERGRTLDYALEPFLRKKLDPEVRILLRMGMYQLLYMDGVPDSAAVDESVRLAAYARKTSARPLVNAVLRGFIRSGKELRLPDLEKDPLQHYSVKYSCPSWLFGMWEEQYGLETAIGLAEASLGRPPLSVRVNSLKTRPEELVEILEGQGVRAERHPWLESCLLLRETGGIDRLPAFREGLFHVQDLASQLCAQALAARPGERVFDLCSAPGSKSFTLAEEMKNTGELWAFDLYEHKIRLIEEGAKRLGISNLRARVQDGTEFCPGLGQADRVLCDVPCSGLGVIRRKPEIKDKNPADFEALPELQYRLLCNAARYVRPGGILVYSTCTTNKKENIQVAKRFLSENNSWEPLQLPPVFDKIRRTESFAATLLPQETGSDGFFLARFIRKG